MLTFETKKERVNNKENFEKLETKDHVVDKL